MANQNYAEAVSAVVSRQMPGTTAAQKFNLSYPYLMQLVGVAKKQHSPTSANDGKEIAGLKEQIRVLQERLDERADTPTAQDDDELNEKYQKALKDLAEERAETSALNKALKVWERTPEGKSLNDLHHKMERQGDDHLREILAKDAEIEELKLKHNQQPKTKPKQSAKVEPITLKELQAAQLAFFQARDADEAHSTDESRVKRRAASDAFNKAMKAPVSGDIGEELGEDE